MKRPCNVKIDHDLQINLFTSHALYLTNVSITHHFHPVRLSSTLNKLTAKYNHSLIAYLDIAIKR